MKIKYPVPSHVKRFGTVLSDKARKTYIPFSPITQGNHGRQVLIDPSLLLMYLSAVDPTSHSGMEIKRKIESIRSHAALNNATTTSAQSTNAFDYMLHVKNIVVYYKLQGGIVYITHLQYNIREGSGETGFYHIKRNAMGRSTNKTIPLSDNSLPANVRTVYVHGELTLEHAKKEFFKRYPNSTAAGLFYFPPQMITNQLGIWKTQGRSKKIELEHAVKELTKVMSKNANKPSTWIVEAEGADLMADSLSQLDPKISFEKHTFKFINPITDVNKLIHTLKTNRKATVDDRALEMVTETYKPLSARTASVIVANGGSGMSAYTKASADSLKGFTDSIQNTGKKSFLEIAIAAGQKLNAVRAELFG